MNLVIVGYGHMGKTIEEVVQNDKEIANYYVVGKSPDSDLLTELEAINNTVDCIVDFSHYSNLDAVLLYGQKYKIPVVIGTTGYCDQDIEKIHNASKNIAICFSGNMSLGVNVLLDVITQVTSRLAEEYDIEIIEKHHSLKQDAPSGTAKMMVDAVQQGVSDKYNIVYGRSGEGKRDKNDLAVHAVRGGTIVGEHSILFAGLDEVVEIKHTATSKKVFARGAVNACKNVIMKKTGLFTMKEILLEDKIYDDGC